MTTKSVRFALGAAAMLLTGCSTSAGGAATQAPTTAAAVTLPTALATPVTTTTTATRAPNPTALLGDGSAPPPDVDPCTLLTKDEASTLKGAKLGDGVGTVLDPDRVCTWRSGLSEVKLILAPQAPDAATAQSYWDAARSDLPGKLPITDVSGFDRAAYGEGSSQGVSVSGFFVIHGTWFFDLFCGFPECSQASSVTAANLIVGRLP